MKILLAIEATKAKGLSDASLRWAPRLGYELKVFAPRNKRKRFLAELDAANYHWYLALKPDDLVTKQTPVEYAQENGYGLIAYIPESLMAWRKGTEHKELDILYGFPAIGNARGEFARQPNKQVKRWANGVRMERV